MKNFFNKLTIPLIVLGVINIIGFIYHTNYTGAVVGSFVGLIVAFLSIEIRAKFE
jgi:hypothetical protein